jgi:hypothetical protein
MTDLRIFASFALAIGLGVIVAAPAIAQTKGSQKTAQSEKVKAANERFNKNYGSKVPEKTNKRVRIDETKNKVRVFKKDSATRKRPASTRSKTRPSSVRAKKPASPRMFEMLEKNNEIKVRGDVARARRAQSKANPARTTQAKKLTETRNARSLARSTRPVKAAQTARAAQAARAAEARAAQAAKAAQALRAQRAAQALRAARAAQASRAALAGGRVALTGARAVATSTGAGLAFVALSIAAEEIAMQEIEHPGKTLRDVSGFFTGLVGTAAVSSPDTATPNAPILESFRIENGRAEVRSSDNGQSGYTTIAFQTNLDWWTAIVIRDTTGRFAEVGKVEGRYYNANAVRIPIAMLPSQAAIEFWTAKSFGIHKQLVVMKYRRERLNGRTVVVNWQK